MWEKVIPYFRRAVQKDAKDVFTDPLRFSQFVDSLESAISFENTEDLKAFLFQEIITFTILNFQDDIKLYSSIVELSDLRLPHQWYPRTRLSKRKIFYHGGPTNSGNVIRNTC